MQTEKFEQILNIYRNICLEVLHKKAARLEFYQKRSLSQVFLLLLLFLMKLFVAAVVVTIPCFSQGQRCDEETSSDKWSNLGQPEQTIKKIQEIFL